MITYSLTSHLIPSPINPIGHNPHVKDEFPECLHSTPGKQGLLSHGFENSQFFPFPIIFSGQVPHLKPFGSPESGMHSTPSKHGFSKHGSIVWQTFPFPVMSLGHGPHVATPFTPKQYEPG